LPQGEQRRIEITHHEQRLYGVLPDQLRHRVGTDPASNPEPVPLVAVAFDRRFPELLGLEPRQGTLQTEPPPRQVDQPDIRRDAALERLAAGPLAGAEDADARERLGNRALVEVFGG